MKRERYRSDASDYTTNFKLEITKCLKFGQSIDEYELELEIPEEKPTIDF